MNRIILALGLFVAARGFAQETQLGAEFRMEGERFKENCTALKKIIGCGQLLFTDHPLHVAVGSLAPQNGFAAGGAFVGHWTPNETWRLNYDMDAVASLNGSWRAGAYLTAALDHHRQIVPRPGGTSGPGLANVAVQEYPVFHAYAQTISLNKLTYFGVGPTSQKSSRTFYGMRETVTGINAVVPLWKRFNIALYGEANGRFVELRPRFGEDSPSIEQFFNSATAPGLTGNQPHYGQFAQGIRIRPSFAGGFIRLNYFGSFQEYISSDSRSSFQRFTLDLGHEFPLYHTTRSSYPRDANGPNDCSIDDKNNCPSVSRNFEGSFSVRFMMNGSFVSSGNAIPFYFMPTLGGSDINGNPALASYQDYRFRAPNTILARATFEHSIYGPVGFIGILDEGKVALNRGDLNFTHLMHSYSTGLTVRAGGLPLITLLFAWGGHEGTHTSVRMSGSLLGGSNRPSLY